MLTNEVRIKFDKDSAGRKYYRVSLRLGERAEVIVFEGMRNCCGLGPVFWKGLRESVGEAYDL